MLPLATALLTLVVSIIIAVTTEIKYRYKCQVTYGVLTEHLQNVDHKNLIINLLKCILFPSLCLSVHSAVAVKWYTIHVYMPHKVGNVQG
jgi:hypothetical protein